MVVALTIGDEPLSLRVSDDALVLHRWKRTARRCDEVDNGARRAQNEYWIPAARAERIAAAACGAPHPRARRTSVREVRNDTADALAPVDDDTILALTEALDDRAFERVASAFRGHPGAMLRLQGGSVEHAASLASLPLQRLTLAERAPLSEIPALRELVFIGAPDVAAIARSCPNLESLTIDANGAAIDIAPLRALPHLRTLQLSSGSIIDGGRSLAELRALRALRVSRVTGLRGCDAFADLPLQTLALEHLHELTDVTALRKLSRLEQLELHALWQFDIADVEWTLDAKRLLRCELDIGGRRKNVELYKRASWAYPWPFNSLSPWTRGDAG